MRSLSLHIIVLAVMFHLFGAQAGAQDDTSTYVFTDKSTVVQTGGFAGVNETYPIQGQFQLAVDANAGVASFDAVNATLLNPTGFLPTQSLGELFNMTVLEGTVISEALIEFRGKTADGTNTDIALEVTFTDDAVQLTGQTIPPANTADFFVFNLDAVAQKKLAGGTGDPNDPYQIATAEQLIGLGEDRNLYDKHFILIADIDLDPNLPGGRVFDRAVIAPDMNDSGLQHEGKPFTGVLDGNGHAISNLTIEGHSYLGLFGYLDSDAIVSNLSIETANVTGISDFVGSLAGFIYGNIIGCYCTGAVSGNDDVGGLVGSNTIGGNITNCYSSVTINGNEKVGGLVGYTKGSVTMCYSTGTVISEGQNTGGLVGERDPSYGVVADCFWDTQTSFQEESAGGVGKTTTEMQTTATFFDAGWDFIGEADNGIEDIWKMWDGYDYPRLAWEPGPNTPLVFVDINDPGVPGYEGFNGQMSKYETTNAQYCNFLNATLASGDIRVDGNDVVGVIEAQGSTYYADTTYYRSDGMGYTENGATNGGAARIHYVDGALSVDEGFENHPVTYVSWLGAHAFATYYGYRLPTEWEWQAVADFDGSYTYGCGTTITDAIANCRTSNHPHGTIPVGSFGVYGYGMGDMAGNVWEWTRSRVYEWGDVFRIIRGGTWYTLSDYCTVSFKGASNPYDSYYVIIGFRVCR